MTNIINKSDSKLTDSFLELTNLMSEIKDLHSAAALLAWDQETYMPAGGNNHRSDQISTIEQLVHRIITSSETQDVIQSINDVKLTERERAIFNLFIDEFDKAVRIPNDLVKNLSEAKSQGFSDWRKALAANDFSIFSGALKRLVELQKEYAEHLHFKNHYNAHLNDFEPGMTTDILDSLFDNLKRETIELLSKVQSSTVKIDTSFGDHKFDVDVQYKLFMEVSQAIGFDFKHGRLDKSIHPFSQAITAEDVRLTTRFDESNILSGLLSTIHESGHGMYEQGISKELYRTFAADGTSVGIHESQSLIWENIIARSQEFWNWSTPVIKKYFGDELSDYTAIDFYQKVNSIQPSFIRTESDELTYNLHIIIRYEIEKAVFNDGLDVDLIPELWNSKMQEYLGVTPDNDKLGCLQDIHWSFGAFGYFPTYTLGKLYSAMLWDTIQKEIPDISNEIEKGNFSSLKAWLNLNIHKHGKLYKPKDLIKTITGKELTAEPFIRNIKHKIETIYQA